MRDEDVIAAAVHGLVADKRFRAVALYPSSSRKHKDYEYPRELDILVRFRTHQTSEDVYPYLENEPKEV